MSQISQVIDSEATNADWLVAWSALATFIVAAAAAAFAFVQVRQAKGTREDVTRPYVVAYLEAMAHNPNLIKLVVRNYGQTAAYNVTFASTPALMRTDGDDTKAIRMFGDLPTLAPGQDWNTFADSLIARDKRELPSRHSIVLEYSGPNGSNWRTDCTLDWDVLDNRSWIVVKGLHDLVRTQEKLTERFLNLSDRHHFRVSSDDEVYARRVARHHYMTTGQYMIDSDAAEATYDQLFHHSQLARRSSANQGVKRPRSRRL